MSEPWIPKPHQKTMVKWLVQHAEAALLADPGLGKSAPTLAAFKLMRKAKGCNKALLVAPRNVCYQVWSHDGEIGKWSDFIDLKVVLLHGDDKDERIDENGDIYVINPAGLEWLTKEKRIFKLFKRGVDTLIIDELSAFKHTSTQRFRLLRPFLGRFRRRWGLTGSPASNGLLDLFGQAYVLDLGRALGQYVTNYRMQFFLPGGFKGHDWTPQEDAEQRIYQALSNLALSMRAEDHLELPELIERDIYVTLPAKVRKIYDELEEELITAVEGDIVTAANMAVASGKCRQVASGGLYVEKLDKRTIKKLHDEKTEALAELVEELQGSPLLVAYEFDHDLERIRERFGDVPAINGKTSAKKSAEYAAAWNRGELPILAGHPASMAHGLNLQASGHHVAWYSLTWNFEFYDQLIRRVYRQGQKNCVIVHRLLARGTIDEVIAGVLGSKKRTQDALLNALRDLRTTRRKVA